jgi:hypothetical protein
MPLRRALIAAPLALLASPARAHRGHGAYTTVALNSRLKRLEVTHSLHVADVDMLLPGGLDRAGKVVAAICEARARQDFLMEATDGALPLSFVGGEVQRSDLLVYFTASWDPPRSALRLQSRFGRGAQVNQFNNVALQIGGFRRTLRFGADSDVQTVAIAR